MYFGSHGIPRIQCVFNKTVQTLTHAHTYTNTINVYTPLTTMLGYVSALFVEADCLYIT